METVTVKKPGFKAMIAGEIPAVIIGVLVKANGSVLYETSWWNGKENKTQWFQECEIDTQEIKPLRIGFASTPFDSPPNVGRTATP